jgi:hypothetical protein
MPDMVIGMDLLKHSHLGKGLSQRGVRSGKSPAPSPLPTSPKPLPRPSTRSPRSASNF